jgi:hypothetical protein
MARAGWLNENEYRDYPFVTQTEPLEIDDGSSSSSSSSSAGDGGVVPLRILPHETIVDAGFILGVTAGYHTTNDRVYLRRVRREDPYLLFEFRTTAGGAAAESLYFVRRTDDPEFVQQWVESRSWLLPLPFPVSSSSVSLSAVSVSQSSDSNPFCVDPNNREILPCGGPGCDTPTWEGFLVTGQFGELLDMLANDSEWTFSPQLWVIEPSRIQNLNGAFVQGISLANRDRTHATVPAECSSASVDDSTVYPNAVCLQGHLKIKEGYNSVIRQETNTNSLIIGAALGAGEGQHCEEVPLYPGETSPDGGPFLTGGPGCGELVKTVNGKGGPDLRLFGGNGVRVTESTVDASTLLVNLDLHNFALCLQPELGPDDPCYTGSSVSATSSGS